MNSVFRPRAAMMSLLLVSAVLGGCAANAPRPLYYWRGDQEQVYGHFTKQSAPEQQIAELEAGLQKARAAGLTPAPGYHAQLGMLYAEVGKTDQVRQQFETEKSLFPESTAYMDFLMRNLAKN